MKLNSALSTKPEQQSGGTRPIFFFLVLVALFGWAYVFFMSDLFLVSDIEVRGLKSVDAYDVKREAFAIMDQQNSRWSWLNRHALFLNREAIEEGLKETLFAELVAVENVHFNVLRLLIEERSNRFIFHSHQQYLWVDLQGVATAELSVDERKQAQARILGQRSVRSDDAPIIHRDLDELIAAGYRVSDQTEVRSWLEFTNRIYKQGFLYREYEPPTASSTSATLISREGYPVFVDLSKDLNYQLNAYNAFKQDKPKELQVKEYVDVRIPGRIYVK